MDATEDSSVGSSEEEGREVVEEVLERARGADGSVGFCLRADVKGYGRDKVEWVVAADDLLDLS